MISQNHAFGGSKANKLLELFSIYFWTNQLTNKLTGLILGQSATKRGGPKSQELGIQDFSAVP